MNSCDFCVWFLWSRLQFWVVFGVWAFLGIFVDFLFYYMPLCTLLIYFRIDHADYNFLIICCENADPEIKMAFAGFLVFAGGATKIYDPSVTAFHNHRQISNKIVWDQLVNKNCFLCCRHLEEAIGKAVKLAEEKMGKVKKVATE